MTHDDDPGDRVSAAVEVRYAAPDLRAQTHLSDVAHQHGRPLLVGLQDDASEVLLPLQVPAPADHVLPPGELQEAPPDLVVAGADGAGHVGDADVVGLEAVGIDGDLVLLDEPPHRGDLGDTGDRLEAVPQGPVLEGAQVRDGVGPGVVHEGILEDPSHTRGIGAQLGPDSLRQQGLDLREVLEDAAPRPIEIGAVLEDDVDVRVAEVGEAADGLDVRSPEESADDRIGHLVFEDVGAPVPPRIDDDLGVGEVGDGVDGNVAERVHGVADGGGGGQKDQEGIRGAPANDPAEDPLRPLHPFRGMARHRRVSGAGEARAERVDFKLDSESSRKLAEVTTRSPSDTPERT